MKRALVSALAVALAMAAARPASASTAYLSWQNRYETDTFTDLGMDEGTNYQSCNGSSVAVGLTANGKDINTVSLLCADIVRTNTSTTTTIDRSTVPTLGNQNQVMNTTGRWLGGINGPNNTCPDGQMMMGASCTGNDCTNMAIYCAAVAPDAPGQQVPVQTPQMTPDNADPNLYVNPETCGWGNTINSGDRASCPPNKVLAGLQCLGDRCSQITLYCCPLIEQLPQDCQYSQWSPSGECQVLSDNDCGVGTQFMSRKITQQPVYSGAACRPDLLQSIQPCYVECNDNEQLMQKSSKGASSKGSTAADSSASSGDKVSAAGTADGAGDSASNSTSAENSGKTTSGAKSTGSSTASDSTATDNSGKTTSDAKSTASDSTATDNSGKNASGAKSTGSSTASDSTAADTSGKTPSAAVPTPSASKDAVDLTTSKSTSADSTTGAAVPNPVAASSTESSSASNSTSTDNPSDPPAATVPISNSGETSTDSSNATNSTDGLPDAVQAIAPPPDSTNVAMDAPPGANSVSSPQNDAPGNNAADSSPPDPTNVVMGAPPGANNVVSPQNDASVNNASDSSPPGGAITPPESTDVATGAAPNANSVTDTQNDASGNNAADSSPPDPTNVVMGAPPGANNVAPPQNDASGNNAAGNVTPPSSAMATSASSNGVPVADSVSLGGAPPPANGIPSFAGGSTRRRRRRRRSLSLAAR